MDTNPKSVNKALPHGGDPTSVEDLFGSPPKGWLDLSTGINPEPYRVDGIEPEAFFRLPPKKSLEALRLAAMKYYGAPNLENVVAAPGTQALIQWLPRLRGISRVAVVGPTYGEHVRVWRQAGHKTTEVATFEQAPDDTDVLVVTNPNNPDGRKFDPGHLNVVCQRLASKGGWLVIDEAFADVAPELSLSAGCNTEGLVVLRSFGKFFGLAGLRLGFALSNPSMAARLIDTLGPWAVSGPTAAIGARALGDGPWIEKTRKKLALGMEQLQGLLYRKGLAVAGGTDLFALVQSDKAPALHSGLAEKGIWTRAFPDHPMWLRFGQPGTADEWERLSDALDALGCLLA